MIFTNYPKFLADIAAMNRMYKLPQIAFTWNTMYERLPQFQDILEKEVAEITDITVDAETANDENHLEVQADMLVNMADLLADLIVYCTSEAARWSIPIAEILKIVMLSNQSKLGADGEPIIDPTNGKFEKGPNYWKPEPYIHELLLHGYTCITMPDGNIHTIQHPDFLQTEQSK